MFRSDNHGRSNLSGHVRVCQADTDMSVSAWQVLTHANIKRIYRFSNIKCHVVHMGKMNLCNRHAPGSKPPWGNFFLICVFWNLSLTSGNHPDKSRTVVFVCQHSLIHTFNYTIDASGPSPKGAGWSDDYPDGNIVQGTILKVTLLHFSDTNHL